MFHRNALSILSAFIILAACSKSPNELTADGTDSGGTLCVSDCDTINTTGTLSLVADNGAVSMTEGASIRVTASGGVQPYTFSPPTGGGTILTPAGSLWTTYTAPNAAVTASVIVTDAMGSQASWMVAVSAAAGGGGTGSGGSGSSGSGGNSNNTSGVVYNNPCGLLSGNRALNYSAPIPASSGLVLYPGDSLASISTLGKAYTRKMSFGTNGILTVTDGTGTTMGKVNNEGNGVNGNALGAVKDCTYIAGNPYPTCEAVFQGDGNFVMYKVKENATVNGVPTCTIAAYWSAASNYQPNGANTISPNTFKLIQATNTTGPFVSIKIQNPNAGGTGALFKTDF